MTKKKKKKWKVVVFYRALHDYYNSDKSYFLDNNVESIYLEMGVNTNRFKYMFTTIKMLRIIFSNTRQMLYNTIPWWFFMQWY